MTLGSVPPKFKVGIDRDQCMDCGRCIENCSYGVYRREGDKILIESRKCTACLRCVAMCPRDAITHYRKTCGLPHPPSLDKGSQRRYNQPGPQRKNYPFRNGKRQGSANYL